METSDTDLHWEKVPARTLNIPATLASGQAFRWRELTNGDWAGAIGDHAVLLRPRHDSFGWQTSPQPDRRDVVRRYLALDVDLERLYAEWTASEPRIGPAVARYSGLRILRQEADESFFAFLCASCNTVVKITRTVQALARRYGEALAVLGGELIYGFPSAARIADASEADLRADLWGYRAPRLIESARHVLEQGPGWLESLRALPYESARCRLMELFGIGPKIADCICLFGLWKDEAVPIDTHVRRIATRMFQPALPARTLTPVVYRALSDLFRQRFGPYAGWAQQYLFCEEKSGDPGPRVLVTHQNA